MQSLRRKQQAEENRIKREEKDRQRKEEEAEKAEEEGGHFPAPVSAKPVPKIRSGAGGPKKPRPKTMVIDSKDLSRGSSGLRSRGSTSNLSNLGASIGDLRRSESRNSLADQ